MSKLHLSSGSMRYRRLDKLPELLPEDQVSIGETLVLREDENSAHVIIATKRSFVFQKTTKQTREYSVFYTCSLMRYEDKWLVLSLK